MFLKFLGMDIKKKKKYIYIYGCMDIHIADLDVSLRVGDLVISIFLKKM